jgi:hypothetical protein
MKRRQFLMVAGAALALIVSTSHGLAAEKIKVLLVGGRGHDWKGFHAVISEVLKNTGDFELTLTTQLDDLKA